MIGPHFHDTGFERRDRFRLPLRALALVLAAILALGVAGCSNDDPACPDFDLGAIEGYVTEAGQPISDIRVHISDSRSHFSTGARPDSAGHFRFDVANGLYTYTTAELGSDLISFSSNDTIRVASDVVRLDFAFGRAEIGLDVPPELEGRRGFLELRGGRSGWATATVENGRAEFSVPRLEPGSYTMRFSAYTLPLELPDMIEVGTDTVSTFTADISGPYAVLEGEVTGAWRTIGDFPPTVKVFAPDSTSLGSAAVDGEGRFAVEVLTGTRFLLGIDDFDGLSFLWGGPTLAEATVFDLEPGDHLSGIEIPEARMRVTLRGPGGMIDHGASARLVDPQGVTHELFRSGGDEPLVIGGLAPGRYFLQVHGYHTDQTWAAQWYGGADSLAAATPIDVTPGEAVDLVMDLEPGGSIAAQVLLGGSLPLAEISCAIFDATGQPLADFGHSNWIEFPAGACTFTGLPDGRFFLAARLSGGSLPVWYPGTTDFAQAEAIIVADHQAVTGLFWDILPGQEVGP